MNKILLQFMIVIDNSKIFYLEVIVINNKLPKIDKVDNKLPKIILRNNENIYYLKLLLEKYIQNYL